MTWKEIKDKIEELGVKDEDILSLLSTEDTLVNLEDLNPQTVQIVGASSDNSGIAVNCWEIYV